MCVCCAAPPLLLRVVLANRCSTTASTAAAWSIARCVCAALLLLLRGVTVRWCPLVVLQEREGSRILLACALQGRATNRHDGGGDGLGAGRHATLDERSALSHLHCAATDSTPLSMLPAPAARLLAITSSCVNPFVALIVMDSDARVVASRLYSPPLPSGCAAPCAHVVFFALFFSLLPSFSRTLARLARP